MADFDKDELSKLPLRERIKRLKELEEQRKNESKEIEDMLKNSESQLRTEEVAEHIAPRSKEVDISRLFGQEEEELEQTIKKEAPSTDTPEGEEGTRYLSLQQAVEDYEELKGINYASMEGELEAEHMQAIDKIGERIDNTKYLSASKEVSNILDASKATLYKIKKYAGLEKQNF